MTDDYVAAAAEFLEKNNISCNIKFKEIRNDKGGEWAGPRNIYTVTFRNRNNKQSMRVIFHDSIANYQRGAEPRLYDVLACLTKSEPGTFSDFCLDYGFPDDSIRARNIYRACKREFSGVARVFGDCLEELAEIW